MTRITVDSRADDVLNLEEFGRFGRFLLPESGWGSPSGMRMSDVARLMPYHSNVRPQECVETIEEMRRRVSTGSLEMHCLRRDRGDACVFHFHGREGAPSAFIAAGGGMVYVASIHEGFPHAIRLSDMGYNAFVVQYRTTDMGAACTDMSAAVSLALGDPERFGVDPSRYSTWGSSAGARVAAYVGSRGPSEFVGGDLPRPDSVIMAYTGHTECSPRDPPTFSVVGTRDGIANPSVMIHRTERLRSMGIDAEVMVVDGIGHGFGLGTGTSADGWVRRAEAFWRRHLRRNENL